MSGPKYMAIHSLCLPQWETGVTICRNRIERTASKRWRGSVRRILSAAIYNLSCFTHGCSTGWVSGVLGTEALAGGAWLAALPCLVALPAAPFFAFLADAKGRKAAVFCVAVSFIISCSLAAWCGGRGVWAARVAAGAGGAGALTLAPLYCAEIAPRLRGLAAVPALACSCGILFAYAAGGVLSAHALSLAIMVPPTVLVLALLWLPETPSFLISIGKIQEAAKVMCWFDGSDFREDLTDVIEQQEVRIRTSDVYHERREVLRRQDSDIFQPMLKRAAESGLESNVCSERKKEPSALVELFRHAGSRRALLSCLALVWAAAASGAGAVASFAAALLQHSARTVPALNYTKYNYSIYNGTLPRGLVATSEAGSVLCGAALVLGAAAAVASADRLGRKMLLLWSCAGISACLALLGAYCDPRLRLHSWYFHHHWPYFSNNFTRTIPTNHSDVSISDVSIRDVSISDVSVISGVKNLTREFNVTDEISKPWYRMGFGNETLIVDSVLWTAKLAGNEDDVSFWPPIILLSMVMFLYNIGLGSVPYVLISELFSVQVRSVASSLLISWMWLSSFLLLRYFGTIAISLGLHATYYICAALTLVSALYILLFIPETKGKTQQQIEQELEGSLIVLGKRRKNER